MPQFPMTLEPKRTWASMRWTLHVALSVGLLTAFAEKSDTLSGQETFQKQFQRPFNQIQCM